MEPVGSDIVELIMSYMQDIGVVTLCRCSCVSRSWNKGASSNRLWLPLFVKHFGEFGGDVSVLPSASVKASYARHAVAMKNKMAMRRMIEARRQVQLPQEDYFRCVILGSGGVGKSALARRRHRGEFCDEYDPTLEDTYLIEEGNGVTLSLVDTAGTSCYTSLRDSAILLGVAFLVVCSVTSRSSHAELQDQLDHILRVRRQWQHTPAHLLPVYLAFNKCDEPEEERWVLSRAEIENTARDTGLRCFMTSAKTGLGVAEVFQAIAADIRRDAVPPEEPQMRQHKRCVCC